MKIVFGESHDGAILPASVDRRLESGGALPVPRPGRGRGWLGCFAVWALSSLGIGEIAWVGAPVAYTCRFAEFLINEHGPSLGAVVNDYSFSPAAKGDLDCVLAERDPQAIVVSEGAGP